MRGATMAHRQVTDWLQRNVKSNRPKWTLKSIAGRRLPELSLTRSGCHNPNATQMGYELELGISPPAPLAAVSRGSKHVQRIQTYSITSSARASTGGGISRPSTFAVLRLMTTAYPIVKMNQYEVIAHRRVEFAHV
jgi:hypothetical protein